MTRSLIPGLTVWLDKNQSPTIKNASVAVQTAHDLLAPKRKGKLSADPVVLTLGNGAVVHAGQGNAEFSENGMCQSKGAMLNDLCGLAHVTANHEQFVTQKVVAASPAVRTLSASISAHT